MIKIQKQKSYNLSFIIIKQSKRYLKNDSFFNILLNTYFKEYL